MGRVSARLASTFKTSRFSDEAICALTQKSMSFDQIFVWLSPRQQETLWLSNRHGTVRTTSVKNASPFCDGFPAVGEACRMVGRRASCANSTCVRRMDQRSAGREAVLPAPSSPASPPPPGSGYGCRGWRRATHDVAGLSSDLTADRVDQVREGHLIVPVLL